MFPMSRATVNLWLDLVALILMLGLMLSGGVLYFVLPPGTGHSHQLFGIGRHDYGAIHAWLSVALVVVLVLHVVLHWTFVCCVVAKQLGKDRPGKKALLSWGAGLFVFTLLLPIAGLVWAKSRVEPSAMSRHNHKEVEASAGNAVMQAGTFATTQTPVAIPAAEQPIERGSADREEAVESHNSRHRSGMRKHEETCPRGSAITGRNTFGEAAAAAGMSVQALAAELKITGAAANTRLGQLRRQSGLSLHAMRQIVCRRDRL